MSVTLCAKFESVTRRHYLKLGGEVLCHHTAIRVIIYYLLDGS